MAAKVTSALLQAHQAALARGDHENAAEFADAAARYALFWSGSLPMLPLVSTLIPAPAPVPTKPKRKPRKGVKRQRTKAAFDPAHAAMIRKVQRANQAIAAFVGLAAVACVAMLGLLSYQHIKEQAHSAPIVARNH